MGWRKSISAVCTTKKTGRAPVRCDTPNWPRFCVEGYEGALASDERPVGQKKQKQVDKIRKATVRAGQADSAMVTATRDAFRSLESGHAEFAKQSIAALQSGTKATEVMGAAMLAGSLDEGARAEFLAPLLEGARVRAELDALDLKKRKL